MAYARMRYQFVMYAAVAIWGVKGSLGADR